MTPKEIVMNAINTGANEDKPYSIIILAFGDWCIIDTIIREEIARFTPQVISYPFILMIGTKAHEVWSETDLIEKLDSVLI